MRGSNIPQAPEPLSLLRVQRIVSLCRYDCGMHSPAVKSAMLLILAMTLGLSLGAVTKFGFGYDLSAKADSHSQKATTRK